VSQRGADVAGGPGDGSADTLRHKLETWQASGKLPLLDGESYMEPSWVAILLGNGFLQRHDPLAERLPLDMVRPYGPPPRRPCSGRSAPDHRFYLDRHCRAAA
jgi:tryptophan halogenase